MLHSLFGGHETAWRSWGEEDSPRRRMLMIHCSLAHSGAWQGVATRLAPEMEMRAFDLPGHGKSGDWHADVSFQEQSVEMAAGLLESWGDGPVDVLGHSFGATVALRLAVERPELVRSLALYEPVFFTAGFRAFPGLQAEHDAKMAPYAEAYAAGDHEGAARAFMSVWGDGRAWERLPEAQREAFTARIPLIDAIRETNYGDPAGMLSRGRLTALTCPVLLMEGEVGPIFAARINDALQVQMPFADRVVIEDAAHMGPVTHAAQVADSVQTFLASEVVRSEA